MRLVGGPSQNEGRLEIQFLGQWNTICDKGWDSWDATVACRQLGFQRGLPFGYAHYGQGSGRIGLWYVACTGQEETLIECRHYGWFNHNCHHYEDAGVVCSCKFSFKLI